MANKNEGMTMSDDAIDSDTFAAIAVKYGKEKFPTAGIALAADDCMNAFKVRFTAQACRIPANFPG